MRCFQILTFLEDVAEVVASVPSREEIEQDRVSDTLVVYITAEDGGMGAKELAGANQDVSEVTVEKYRAHVQAESSGFEASETGDSRDEAPNLESKVAQPAQDAPAPRGPTWGIARVDVGLLDFLMNMVGELVTRTRPLNSPPNS